MTTTEIAVENTSWHTEYKTTETHVSTETTESQLITKQTKVTSTGMVTSARTESEITSMDNLNYGELVIDMSLMFSCY